MIGRIESLSVMATTGGRYDLVGLAFVAGILATDASGKTQASVAFCQLLV